MLERDSRFGADSLASVSEAICAVIVTYHPDSDLFSRVERAAKQVAQTVIVDNGSSPPCVQEIRKIADTLGIHLVLNARNEGVGRALNQGAEWAAAQGYRWILTLDQDTVIAADMADSLIEVLHSCSFAERVAVVGSDYRNKVKGRVLEDLIEPNGSPGREVTTVITSGSLVSLEVFRTIGGFRDEFFIDCVDHEYCLRARARGFRVMMTCAPLREHSIGRASEHRLLWKRPVASNHPPLRQYFMTRNTVILAREYMRKEPRWILTELWRRAKSILIVCLFERERLSKIKHIARGFRDGIRRRAESVPQEEKRA
jgi:rhamnosyltransferase